MNVWVKYCPFCFFLTYHWSSQRTIQFQESVSHCLGLQYFQRQSQVVLNDLPGTMSLGNVTKPMERALSFYLMLNQTPCGRQLGYNRRGSLAVWGVWVLPFYNCNDGLAWHSFKYPFWTHLITSRMERFYLVTVHGQSFQKGHAFQGYNAWSGHFPPHLPLNISNAESKF